MDPSRRRTGLLGRLFIPVAAVSLLTVGLAPRAQAQNRTRIMPLGDSITEAFVGNASYRYWAWRELENRGFCVDFVGSRVGVLGGAPIYDDFDQDHEGHSGWHCDDVLPQAQYWADTAHPDIVLLQLGTNDLFSRQPDAGIAIELSQIIDRLRLSNPGITIMIAELTPIAPGRDISVKGINNLIPRLAKIKTTTNSRVVSVDLEDGFDPLFDTFDGVHPNSSGELKIAMKWIEALSDVLRYSAGCGPGTTFCVGDEGLATCPCGNESTPEAGQGCRNSSGMGALLLSEGTADSQTDDLVLRVTQGVPHQPALFLQSNTWALGSPFGGGNICLGAVMWNVEQTVLDANGCAETSVSVVWQGSVRPGDERYYQVWYRDGGGTCGEAFNMSAALGVTWH